MTFQCDRCEQEITLETEGQYQLLHASCGCKGRYVKANQVLPERWSE